MTSRVVSFQDGPRLTVNLMIKNPKLIPARILSMMDQAFFVDQILRNAGSNDSGVVQYHESTPQFANDGTTVVKEFGEIPVTTGDMGKPQAAHVVKRAMALMISREMIDRNNVDRVNTQLTQIKNTFARDWEAAFLAQVRAKLPTMASTASGAWSAASTTGVRKDLADALLAIQLASTDAADTTGKNKLGFDPDTIVLNHAVATYMALNDDMNKYFVYDRTAQAPAESFTLPGLLFGRFKVIKSWQLDNDSAIVVESKTIGGISDERPISSTPLYEDKPRETFRSDVVRSSAVFIDQPKAGIVITGIAT